MKDTANAAGARSRHDEAGGYFGQKPHFDQSMQPPLEEIPDTLIKATLATEDRRFFEHFGVDIIGTARALMENARANEVVQGGSTLTQQLAKNLFLSSERSFQRKLKEAFLALLLEARFTKRQILKLYLDRAYLGGGTVGVEAASLFYFGKSVRDINLAELALLAGLFKARVHRRACHGRLDRSRRLYVHARLYRRPARGSNLAQIHGRRPQQQSDTAAVGLAASSKPSG